ncbi:MAG: hypothetical protein AAGA80_14685 [Cyanobacteria bacterium P01_F01_bin.143]
MKKSASSPSAKQPNEKQQSSSKISETNWERLASMEDDEIKLTLEHPEADVNHMVNGVVRHGLQHNQ